MKLQASMTMRSSRNRDLGAIRGHSISAARWRGVTTNPVTGGATSCGPDASATGCRGPRVASTSRSARSILPAGWGACVAAATCDGAFRAPPGVGPRRVKAMEVPGAALFAALSGGAPMHKGPPALGVHRAGTFALFWLLGGHPRHFAPELVDPAAVEEAEGSIARGGICGGSSTEGSGQSVEGVEEAAFKRRGWRQSVKSQRGNRSVGVVPCSEVTIHHGGLMPQGLLRRPPLRLTSCGRATRPRLLHLHMVL
jgi:hypothetical protein